MKDESSRQIIKAEEIKEMFPCYKYAVVFLEAEDIIQRKIGYSLLAPLYKLLPQELQEYVRYIWEVDTEKRKMPYSFVKCCEKIFAD